ncbi:AAA family ATPase [Halosegnis longus]|uniref:MoxR family ATPase n=1 Tax=Halosegnis longus TaxID=2216012 RepID=A0AAJ4R7P9_9EURY|nr:MULTISPECIES: MoxR family ATPase [Halobacteriales]RNJ25770.1 MoxR family ATPase [Salella cibi]
MDISETSAACGEVLDTLRGAIIADDAFFEDILLGLLSRGHVLIEDVPGTGKTLTARSMATALGLSFSRIQFTPDLLPSDVTGTTIYDEGTGEFEFSEGPIFANVVLADEINRAPPKTQAALLEAMEEEQVTVDGTTYELPSPFFLVATQNPVEQSGNFPLPEAQLDRFSVKTSMGYPDTDGEIELLKRRLDRMEQSPSVETVLDTERVVGARDAPEQVRIEEDLLAYMVDVTQATRSDRRVEVGVSPRGTQRLLEATRAAATLADRDFVTPDDVKRVATPVLAHRLVLTPDATVENIDKRDVLADVLDRVEVPTV